MKSRSRLATPPRPSSRWWNRSSSTAPPAPEHFDSFSRCGGNHRSPLASIDETGNTKRTAAEPGDYEWIDNPVFRRETRLLTRGKLPALLFIGGPTLAAFILFFRYSVVSLAYGNQSGLAITGRGDFVSLASILFWILILIVPALAGGTIHKDRSSGTLTSIRLTPMSAWSILGGKCLALGAFVGLVFLTLLPIWGWPF
jgi:hypothetical protein